MRHRDTNVAIIIPIIMTMPADCNNSPLRRSSGDCRGFVIHDAHRITKEDLANECAYTLNRHQITLNVCVCGYNSGEEIDNKRSPRVNNGQQTVHCNNVCVVSLIRLW